MEGEYVTSTNCNNKKKVQRESHNAHEVGRTGTPLFLWAPTQLKPGSRNKSRSRQTKEKKNNQKYSIIIIKTTTNGIRMGDYCQDDSIFSS